MDGAGTMNAIVMIVALGLMVVGCAPHRMHFDCAAGKGMGCTSVTKVNARVDEDLVGTLVQKTLPQSVQRAGSDLGLRDPEQVLRVWFAPYVDAEDMLQGAQMVTLVVTPSRWRPS